MKPKTKKAINISLTVLFVAALVIFMITFSIGLPIYCRFFYYIQIKTLKMEEATGWSYSTIKRAYDDILNFCTLPGYPCKTGELYLSEEGQAHFADCKVLFDLNFWALLSSGVITLALTLLNRFKVITLCRPFKHRPYLLSAVIGVAIPVIIALLAVIVGFDNAFAAFHKVFFPNKENWVFDPMTEQIIEVMPEEFFMNCAIIIGVGLVAFAAALIIADVVLTKKEKKVLSPTSAEEEAAEK